MTGRMTKILATALLAGSLLATGAQARGGGGGGFTMVMAMEDVISPAVAFTTTAMVARITRHTTGRTPAPPEW